MVTNLRLRFDLDSTAVRLSFDVGSQSNRITIGLTTLSGSEASNFGPFGPRLLGLAKTYIRQRMLVKYINWRYEFLFVKLTEHLIGFKLFQTVLLVRIQFLAILWSAILSGSSLRIWRVSVVRQRCEHWILTNSNVLNSEFFEFHKPHVTSFRHVPNEYLPDWCYRCSVEITDITRLTEQLENKSTCLA